jgi:hypothetical protein
LALCHLVSPDLPAARATAVSRSLGAYDGTVAVFLAILIDAAPAINVLNRTQAMPGQQKALAMEGFPFYYTFKPSQS